MSEIERGTRGDGRGRPMSSLELERELEATRQEMRGTLDAIINQKLSPDALIRRARAQARDVFGGPEEFARNLNGAVRRNPVPATIAAIGLGWLMWSDRHPASASRHGAGDAAHEMADTAEGVGHEWKERTQERTAAARERVQGAMARGRERGGEWVDSARLMGVRARRAGADVGNSSRRLFEEQPFLVGTLALAVGALIGAALPRTRFEDETIGPVRDRTMAEAAEKAREAGSQIASEAEHRIEEAGHAAREAIARKGKKGRQSAQQPRRH